MVTSGIVREWHDDEGWGVIDSPDAPGWCWAHFSSVETPGDRRLRAGQMVTLEIERAEQDGYAFRAIGIGVGEEARSCSAQDESSGAAYSTKLIIRYTDPTDPPDRDD